MVKVSDGVESAESFTYGGRGGSENHWKVPAEGISRVVIRYTFRVNSLKFLTNINYHSPQFGGYDGEQRTYTLPNGYRIYGIYGKSSGYVNELGFHLIAHKISA